MAIDLKSFLNHAEGATGPSRLGTGDDGIEPSPACGRAFFVAGRLRHATSHIPPSVVLPCCASITVLCRRAQNSTQGVHPKNLSSPIRPNPRESINLPLQGISAPPRTIKNMAASIHLTAGPDRSPVQNVRGMHGPHRSGAHPPPLSIFSFPQNFLQFIILPTPPASISASRDRYARPTRECRLPGSRLYRSLIASDIRQPADCARRRDTEAAALQLIA